jgi:hypothetical protein
MPKTQAATWLMALDGVLILISNKLGKNGASACLY